MSDFISIILSHATYAGPSGATAAATYAFASKDYQPPLSERHIEYDIVKNQNGKFKHLYDSGPGFARWKPFEILCENAYTTILEGNGQVQYNRLKQLWEHPGVLGMKAPGGIYTVHWGDDQERSFRVFPRRGADASVLEYTVGVQFEEAQ